MSTPVPSGRVAIFGPHPLLSVTIEARGPTEDDIHVHPAGQGVWVAKMAAELGGQPALCGFIGGETGQVLRPLLDGLPGQPRLTEAASASGCYVTDRRSGSRELVAAVWAGPPSRHEMDELFSSTCAAALDSDVLVVCNPMPGESLSLEVYSNLVSDVRANGTPVLVDLSSPRLDAALEGGPDLVKLNDWELAEFVRGPVGTPDELRGAVDALRSRGASSVVVTRGGEPALAFREGEAVKLTPPRFERGSREGCGDSMMGALAAATAGGLGWRESLTLGVAAGAVNFLRSGLGTGGGRTIRDMCGQVTMEDWSSREWSRAD